MQRISAIVLLTLRAAVRFRLVVTLALLLFAIVLVLPAMVKHDGTARGLVQIVLTYTLGAITALLGFATLWLACGTLARDIEDCQLQVVVTKPIARWQIWVGKWLGIVLLNGLLLLLAGTAVFTLIQLKARELPPDQKRVLRQEVLVARGSVKEPVPDLSQAIEEQYQTRLQRLRESGTRVDLNELRKVVTEEVKRVYQLRPPGFGRRWILDMSPLRERLRDQPLQLRLKFHTPQTIDMEEPSAAGTFVADVRVGPHQQPLQTESLSAGTYHELVIPPNMIY